MLKVFIKPVASLVVFPASRSPLDAPNIPKDLCRMIVRSRDKFSAETDSSCLEKHLKITEIKLSLRGRAQVKHYR